MSTELLKVKSIKSNSFGGKADNLELLKVIGLPVPAFKVITYKQLINVLTHDQLSAIENLINKKTFTRADQQQFEELIKQVNLHSILDDEEIKQFLNNQERYAVRSSNSLEDGTTASWAGIFESALNVKTHDILEAVRKCWCSTYTESSFLYCSMLQKKPFIELRTNIIVQRMVNAHVAGVIFSRNPADSNDERALVEYVAGTAEVLVSGHVNPDRLFVDKDQFDRIEDTNFPLDKLINGLLLAEHKLNCDVDIEWAWDGSTLYFLQVRPVTAQSN